MLRNIHIGACTLLAIGLGCTESYKPDVSTETGNPPVTIDSAKIALVVSRDEVHVRGESGAVMPPEADVEITIVRTGDATLTAVEDDGSFDVEVDATLSDVFEVRAILGDDASDVVIVVRGGSEVIEGDGGGLSCEQQTNLGGAILDAALATADRSCEVASDCIAVPRQASCVTGCLAGYYSMEGATAITEATESIDDGVCSSFEGEGCRLDVPPCVPPRPAACMDGQCVEYVGGGSECGDNCFERELSWMATGPGTLPALIVPTRRTLSNCDTLDVFLTESQVCNSQLPRCAFEANDSVSVANVQEALQHDDVVQAFEQGGTFGEPESESGIVYELTLDGTTITYRSCATSDCAPNGLEALVDLLVTLSSEHECEVLGPEPQARCTLPWADDNMCDGAIPRWWHDPQTGACLQRIYGGCGGNDNNYVSEEACRDACPPPADPGACPPNRVFVAEMCFDCGPLAECEQPAGACLLVCSEDAHCEGEEPSFNTEQTCSAEGVCRPELLCD